MAACVLMVEDNEVNRYLVRFVLEKGGFRVITAGNGREAIELARLHRPDMILMDIQMPVMDGYEASASRRWLPAAPGTSKSRSTPARSLRG
jgi:CheY-like chemotaxis protein